MPITTITQEQHVYPFIDNYIYLYHTSEYLILPGWPESLTDTMNVTYNSTTPMARTAPIYSYSNSGPRVMQINLNLHRDLMTQVNYKNSSVQLDVNDDYVDILARKIQAIALPRYDSNAKMVDPPIVAVRLGNEIFIKGVVTGSVTISYGLPILDNNKYAQVGIGFTVSEIEPYDAFTVQQVGSFRQIDTSLERNVFKYASTTNPSYARL